MPKYVIGVDYGTDSARAIVVDTFNGDVLADAVKEYPRWSRGLYCNPQANQFRQHPLDYLEVLEATVTEALSKCDPGVAENVVGIGFDTTGSTPAFVNEDGTPLAMLPGFEEDPDAMFILWKDHTAIAEAEEINALCREEGCDYVRYEGGTYSAEWMWAKAAHVLRNNPRVAQKAWSVVECCEWLPAVLTGVRSSSAVIRSRCAMGHKAMWHADWGGLPPVEFISRIDPRLEVIRKHLPDTCETADKPVGFLCEEWARKLGIGRNVVVAGGAYDCHMGAVGAGIRPHTLVRVIGTSTCDILVAPYEEIGSRCIKDICGQVDGSVIPGMIGLEAGQSSFGDVYAMFRRILEFPVRQILPKILKDKVTQEEIATVCQLIIPALAEEAEKMEACESGMLSTDWINGRRSPGSNPLVKGTVSGFTLGTTAPAVYRSLVEATAFGTKAISDCLESQGMRIDEITGIGGIPHKSPLVMQIMADVLGKPIKVCRTIQACALGAAMFAATAAGVYPKVEDASEAMSSGYSNTFYPIPENTARYQEAYKEYLKLGKFTESELYFG